MRSDRIDWPNSAGSAWPASVWAQLDQSGGTATFTQQSGFGQIVTTATAGMAPRAISTSQLKHRDMEWRGTLQCNQAATQTHDFFFRATGDWGANSLLPTAAYVFEYDMAGSAYNAYQVTANTAAGIAGAPGATSFSFTANTVYNILMKLNGYFTGMKIWAVGTNEPGTWGWSFTDTAHAISATTQGVIQYSSFQTPATATTTKWGNAVLLNDMSSPNDVISILSLLDDAPPMPRGLFINQAIKRGSYW